MSTKRERFSAIPIIRWISEVHHKRNEAKRFQYYVCLKPKEAKDASKIQKNRFIQADFPENICSIDIFCYKEQIKVAFTMGTSNQKQVLLGYQLLIVVSLNHYNLLDYADT